LLKAVHFWTDLGFGEFGLHFLRDKQKREVDFVVVRDGKPWFLVEVKHSGSASLSPHLAYFQQHSGAGHDEQVSACKEFYVGMTRTQEHLALFGIKGQTLTHYLIENSNTFNLDIS